MYAWRKVDTRVVLSIKRTFRRVCVCFHGQLMQKKVLVRCTLYNEKFQQQPLSFMNVSKGKKTVFFLAVYSSEVGEFQNCYVTKLKCCLFSIYQIEVIKFFTGCDVIFIYVDFPYSLARLSNITYGVYLVAAIRPYSPAYRFFRQRRHRKVWFSLFKSRNFIKVKVRLEFLINFRFQIIGTYLQLQFSFNYFNIISTCKATPKLVN